MRGVVGIGRVAVVGGALLASACGNPGDVFCSQSPEPSVIVNVFDARTELPVSGVIVLGINAQKEYRATCIDEETPCGKYAIAEDVPGYFDVQISVRGYDDEAVRVHVQDGVCHVETEVVSVGLLSNE